MSWMFGGCSALESLDLSRFNTEKVTTMNRMFAFNENITTIYVSGKGAYSGDEKQVICCAVRKNDYVKVKRYVKEVDESAFMIITSAKEVLGKGFKEIN